MIRCRECGTDHYPGMLFCRECGALLAGRLPEPAASPVEIQYVQFLLPQSGRQLQFDLSAPIWIGRSDPEVGFWPRLDLTADGGVEMGVSRRHALIEPGTAGVVLVDKGSANGTWVDEERLQAERPFPLPRKCQVRFGNLRVHIHLS